MKKIKFTALLAGCILLASVTPGCAQISTTPPALRFTVATNNAGFYILGGNIAEMSGFYTNQTSKVAITNWIPALTPDLGYAGGPTLWQTNLYLSAGTTNFYISLASGTGGALAWEVEQVVFNGATIPVLSNTTGLTSTNPPSSGWMIADEGINGVALPQVLYWQPAGTVTNYTLGPGQPASVFPPTENTNLP